MIRVAGAVLAGLAACNGRSNVPVGTRTDPAIAAAMVAADSAQGPWRCAAPDGPSVADETLTAGAHRWQLGARVMKLDAPGEIAIGVFADAAGSAAETLAALGRLRAGLAHVDLVISLGGMGATRAELEATFAALTDGAAWPLVALPGDLEPVPAQTEAIAAMRQRGAAVIDGRLLQRIELPAATIALVPGAGAAGRLAAGMDGCAYRAADVTAVFADLTPRAGLRILASAEAPREPDNRGEPTGELALTAGAGQQIDERSEIAGGGAPGGSAGGAGDHPRGIDLALHGPTSGAATPACSGQRDGSAVSLTPGASDATPRLPGPRRAPTAGILTLHGNAWTWKPITDVH